MIPVISIKNFTKKYFQRPVVSDLSFDVKEGELFAFLGPNGSGKTTTLRCLLNIIPKTSGDLMVLGKNYDPSMSDLIGYLPEERGLYNNSSVKEVMTYFAQLKGMSYSKGLKETLRFLEKVELPDKLNSKIKTLSSGQQQKIQLGLTLINKPKILILDEPTKGLDPVNREILLNILFELNKTNASTILFSTHQMEEVEKIADRLLMLMKGKEVLYGPLKDIISENSDKRYEIEYIGDFPKNDDYYSFKLIDGKAIIIPKDDIEIEAIIKFLFIKAIKVNSFRRIYLSLEQIFINTVDKK